MKIQQDILDNISAVANSEFLEIGGILGSSKNGVITDMATDLSPDAKKCRFEYYPDTDYLNMQIQTWAENDIEFSGFFHTHFSGSKNLSDVDINYIKSIMLSSKGIVEYLYFPIFTLPDNELTVYKACFYGGEIVITKDELIII